MPEATAPRLPAGRPPAGE